MINAIKKSSAVILTYKVGVDKKGEDVFSSQRFSKVNKAATEEEIYNFAKAMEELLAYPLYEVKRAEDFSIVKA